MEICFNTKKENKMEKGALEDGFVYSEVKSSINDLYGGVNNYRH